jgi:formylglycine-generating enzyme
MRYRSIIAATMPQEWMLPGARGLGIFLGVCAMSCLGSVTKPPAARPDGSNDKASMIRVPAGPFLRGTVIDEEDNIEYPQRSIYLDTFFIDKYEVSLDQYRRCVEAGACSKLDFPSQRCNWSNTDRENHPANCVNWHQAQAYCDWAGKRLPTEAEWEKAARGVDGRLYPWGNDPPTCERAVMKEGADGCGKVRTWPVSSKSPAGDSPYGASNMSGNVMEWVNDWFAEDYYRKSPDKNPPGPSTGKYKSIRGGSWYYLDEGSLRAASRHFNTPDYCSAFIGFRCARAGR